MRPEGKWCFHYIPIQQYSFSRNVSIQTFEKICWMRTSTYCSCLYSVAIHFCNVHGMEYFHYQKFNICVIKKCSKVEAWKMVNLCDHVVIDTSTRVLHRREKFQAHFLFALFFYLSSSSLIDCILSILTVSPSNCYTLSRSIIQPNQSSNRKIAWQESKKYTLEKRFNNDCALFKCFIYSDVEVHVRHPIFGDCSGFNTLWFHFLSLALLPSFVTVCLTSLHGTWTFCGDTQ